MSVNPKVVDPTPPGPARTRATDGSQPAGLRTAVKTRKAADTYAGSYGVGTVIVCDPTQYRMGG